MENEFDLKRHRLFTAVNNAATAVHMLTAADQVLVIARHGDVLTINAQEEATRKHLVDIEKLLVKALIDVRKYKRSIE